MITAGDNTLETYITNIENAFRKFEQQNGKPDQRVMIISLKDDILKIKRVAENGEPLSTTQREQLLQMQLNDRLRINSEGFIAFPFPLSVLSDDSRVFTAYNQAQNSLHRSRSDRRRSRRWCGTALPTAKKEQESFRVSKSELKYYALPQRTAVLNTFFNATKDLDRAIYQNYRLRDRPLGNTHWELLINQYSEKENQDINLNSINDIKLYVYYTDFTTQ